MENDFITKELLKLLKQKDTETDVKLKILDCIDSIIKYNNQNQNQNQNKNQNQKNRESIDSRLKESKESKIKESTNPFMRELSQKIKDFEIEKLKKTENEIEKLKNIENTK